MIIIHSHLSLFTLLEAHFQNAKKFSQILENSVNTDRIDNQVLLCNNLLKGRLPKTGAFQILGVLKSA